MINTNKLKLLVMTIKYLGYKVFGGRVRLNCKELEVLLKGK